MTLSSIPAGKSEYFYYLDLARAVFMVLGIVLHSALVYSPGWLISDPSASSEMSYVVSIIGQFRMPAFFLISGFFFALSFQKYGTLRLLFNRFVRIGIPFLCVIFFINSIEAFILYKHLGKTVPFLDYFMDFRWLSHLWFLKYLLLYIAVASLFFNRYILAFFLEPIFKFVSTVLQINFLKKTEFFFLLPLPSLAIMLLPFSWMLTYFVYFMAGVFLFFYRDCFDNFLFPKKWIYWIGVPLALCLIFYPWQVAEMSKAEKLIYYYIEHLVTWIEISFVLRLFKKWFSKPSTWAPTLAESSYSVYLFHHILVICLGILLMELPISIYIKFLLVISTVTLITFILHMQVIRKSPILSFLFNGKLLKRANKISTDNTPA